FSNAVVCSSVDPSSPTRRSSDLAYTELQQIFTTPGIWAAIVFFALWVLLVPLVSMFPSVVIGSGGWARRLSFGGPIIVFMGYYLVMQLVGVASLFMHPVYDLFKCQL